MNEEERQLVREVAIREGAALALMAAVLWYVGPGKLWLSGVRHRIGMAASGRSTAIDVKVEQFRAEVSRWEHEQAAQPDR